MKATAHAPIERPDTYQRLPTARPHLRTAAGPIHVGSVRRPLAGRPATGEGRRKRLKADERCRCPSRNAAPGFGGGWRDDCVMGETKMPVELQVGDVSSSTPLGEFFDVMVTIFNVRLNTAYVRVGSPA